MEAMTRYLVRDRQEGKTTELVMWVCRGHEIEGYPGWSRGLVVPTFRDTEIIAQYFRDADQYLRTQGFSSGLGSLIFHWGEMRAPTRSALGRVSDEFEIAIDGADRILVDEAMTHGPKIRLMSLGGQLFDPESDTDDTPEPPPPPSSPMPGDSGDLYERFAALRYSGDRITDARGRRSPRGLFE